MLIFVSVVCALIVIKYLLRCCLFVAVGMLNRHRAERYRIQQLVREEKINDSIEPEVETYRESRVKEAVRLCLDGMNKYVVKRIGQIPSHTIRNFFYKHILRIKMENNVVIYNGAVIRDAYKLHIAQGTIIGDDNMLDARGGLTIGKHCNFSTAVKIWTAQHNAQGKAFEYESAEVKIGDKCWISGGTTILPGITIGEGCVIASGAVVTKECKPYGIYAGIPAKRIGERDRDLVYEFDGKHDWFL